MNMQNRTISESDLELLESTMTTIVHLVMTLPADKLALFVEACERQEAVLALSNPAQFVRLSEQLTRGGAVARALLNFRNELAGIKQIKSGEE